MRPESLPRLKAPAEHGAVLSIPPLADVGELLAANRSRSTIASVQLQNRSLRDLQVLARREVIDTARAYLAECDEPVPEFTGDRVLLAGHQPELFHPGVWLKNFALQGLARRHNAVPLNLIVDNDAAKPALIRVPHGAQVARVPFDSGASDVPYEERLVHDEARFATLPERVAALTADWPFRPMLHDYWRSTTRRTTPNLGERLAASRRDVERRWGATPFEVPLSRVCATEAFAWFAVHILRELPRFHATYNAAVQGYRHRHGLRSAQHPVPDLARDGDWHEVPFWTWRTGAPRRQRLWALLTGVSIDLRAGNEALASLKGAAAAQAAQWRQLPAAGIKLRTRALTTTLFARLLLGDLFIHGIGGGKYDEVTDDIIREFFGGTPPGYIVLTATLLLPLERDPGAAAELARMQYIERDLHWNPQRHLDGAAPAAATLMHDKQAWIERACTTHPERVQRFTELRHINERLQPYVANAAARLHQEHTEALRRQRTHEIRSSREYPFCLFPEEMLQSFYQQTTTRS